MSSELAEDGVGEGDVYIYDISSTKTEDNSVLDEAGAGESTGESSGVLSESPVIGNMLV
jgi:hypothetical protein